MSYFNYTEELLGIQDIATLKVEEIDNITHIRITHKRRKQICPRCGLPTNLIHDYREQPVKDLLCFDKPVLLHVRKRRYHCSNCGKNFAEKLPYLPKYARRTRRLTMKVLDALAEARTFTSVAHEFNLSINTVFRIFDVIHFATPELPKSLSIDEFRGNTGGEKFNCIIADPETHKVLDILPRRNDWYIQEYFLKYPREIRNRIQIFVSDMWKPYQDTAKALFSKSTRVIDKYHWMRQVIWAFERIRKDTQKHLSPTYRRYFKHSRNLLLKPIDSLSEDDRCAVKVMLYADARLSSAHFYKDWFLQILRVHDRAEAKTLMDKWIESASHCGIDAMQGCARTMQYWKTEILDSFNTPYTNGFIEGCNNKIKVLKRTAYGYRNFERFRNRILYIFSKEQSA